MKKNKALVAVIFAILSIAACTKFVSTDIGVGELIPPIDGVTVKDTTFEVIVNTHDTTALTAYGLENMHILGIYDDAEFGKTQADIYAQFQPANYPFRFAVPVDSIKTIDSVVLVMQTDGTYYGDSTQNMGFRAFQINDPTFDYTPNAPFSINKTFTTSSEITYNGTEQFVSPLSLKDTTKNVFLDSSGIGQIRIRLNNSFAQQIMNMDTASFRNDTLFRQAFKGIKVSSTSGNALTPIYLASSRLAIYYKYINRTDGSDDTTVAYLNPDIRSASSNNIINNRTGTTLTSMPVGNTTTGSEFIHLQAAPGVYARLTIPGLSALQNRMIYRAELIIDEVPQTVQNKFFPNLFLAGIDNSGRRVLLKDASIGQKYFGNNVIDDYYIAGLTAFGSAPFIKKDSINNLNYYQYNFKLTSHVQDIVKGVTPNYPIDIFVPSRDSVYSTVLSKYVDVQGSQRTGEYYNLNYPAIQRIKVYGNNTNNPHKMRLRVVYSPIQ